MSAIVGYQKDYYAMRLSSAQQQQIITAIQPFINQQSAELRLFGSRVNDAAKGGDIDLLLVMANEQAVQQLLEEKHKILVAIKSQIGEQKIDLLIASPERIKNDAFLNLIFPDSVILTRW